MSFCFGPGCGDPSHLGRGEFAESEQNEAKASSVTSDGLPAPPLSTERPLPRRMNEIEKHADKMMKKMMRKQHQPRFIREAELDVKSILRRPKRYGLTKEGAKQIVEKKLSATEQILTNAINQRQQSTEEG
jgi:hypothetical protein